MTQRSPSEADASPATRSTAPLKLQPFTSKLLAGLGICFILAWAAVVWFTLRPNDIVSDWNSGRQADTQTIAINLTRDGSSMLWPQIACSRDGPGYVETELQLYTKLAATLMDSFGISEWAGQIISLFATVATAAMIWIHLGHRYGLVGALVGVLAFLGQRTSPHLATVVMPDALALLAYVAAWTAFYRYVEFPRARNLVLFAVIGAVAMLQKPSMAQIGVSSFLLLAMTGRARLLDYRVWIAWGAMVVAFVVYQAHAHSLYVEYGNTFGVLFGEDRKTPQLHHLFMPEVLWGAAQNTIRWGYGHVGTLALIALVVMRRVEAEHVALLAGNVLLTFVALRYTSQDAGNYYFAPGNLLASSAIAAVTNEGLRRLRGNTRWIALTALVGALGLQLVRNAQVRHLHAHFDDPVITAVNATARQLAGFTSPGDLIVVRSPHEAYDTFWDCPGRVCEPRTFLVSDTRGWTLARDGDPKLILEAAARGARYFVDPVGDENATLGLVLNAAGELIWSQPGVGKIWRLRSADARKP